MAKDILKVHMSLLRSEDLFLLFSAINISLRWSEIRVHELPVFYTLTHASLRWSEIQGWYVLRSVRSEMFIAQQS